MKINADTNFLEKHHKAHQELLTGKIPKKAAKQVDQVEDVNFKGAKSHHRISVVFNKELKKPIVNLVDNHTGETVKKAISDAEVDRMIRIDRLKGLTLDKKL